MTYFTADPSTPSEYDALHVARITHHYDDHMPSKNKERRRNRRAENRRRRERREYLYQ